MRKDLKIGMAIGAVLLAVVFVYFLMPKPEGSEFAGTEPGGDVTSTTDADAAPVEPGAETQPEEQRADAAPLVADAQKPDVFAKEGDDSAADPNDDVAGQSSGGTNWAKLLGDGGGTLVPLRTTTPALADRDNGATGAVVASDGAGSSTSGTTSPDRPGGATAAGTPPGSGDGTGARGTGDTGSATTLRPDNSKATVEPQPKQPQADPPGRYTFKPDDNYSKIAEAHYGSSRHYLAIEKANPDLDATRIRPGTVINLPDPATINSSEERAVAKVVDPESEYEVQSNDSLYKIALDRYGSSKMTDEIYELNKQAIGPDPKRLKLGMILKLPPKPKSDASASR